MAANRVKIIKAKKKGQDDIEFKPGALHEQLGIDAGQKIPAAKMAAAKTGQYGALARKRAMFAQNVLTGPKS